MTDLNKPMAGAGEKPDERADDAEPVAEGVEATNKPAGTPEAVKPAAPEKTKAPKQIAALKGEVQQGQEAAQAEAKVDEEVGNLKTERMKTRTKMQKMLRKMLKTKARILIKTLMTRRGQKIKRRRRQRQKPRPMLKKRKVTLQHGRP